MGWLVKREKDREGTIKNLWKSFSPWLFAQSDKISQNVVKHKRQTVSVDLEKDIILKDVEGLIRIRDKAFDKLNNSKSNEERFNAERDFQYAEERLRQFSIVNKALGYLPENEKPEDDEEKEISDHWLDKFNEYTRVRNESWREDLLARALATEASNPGSVPVRALWLMGTMEEKCFNAFASILDLCVDIDQKLSIPVFPELNINPLLETKIPNYLKEEVTLGYLVHYIGDLPLVANISNTGQIISKGEEIQAEYGTKRITLINNKNEDKTLRVICPTTIGHCIASFCDRRQNKFGEQHFDSWIKHIEKDQDFILVDISDSKTTDP